MSTIGPQRRVRVTAPDADGFPVVRYGVLADPSSDLVDTTDDEYVVVLLDGEGAGAITVERHLVDELELTSFELRLSGHDLLDHAELRRGLARLWEAEARAAGLRIDALHPVGDGLRDSSEGYLLAELVAASEHLVLRAVGAPGETVVIRVDRPNRFEL